MGSLDRISGCLLVYLIWAFWGAAFSIYTNGLDVAVMRDMLPEMVRYAVVILILVLLFYGYYVFLLIQLIRKKQGIVAKIKLMIIATPIFNACLPAISAFCLGAVLDNVGLLELLKQVYNPTVLGSLFGAAVMALVWYRYFTVSKRVHCIWPSG